MAKKLSELKPSDQIVVELGAKTQQGAGGKTTTIEKAREQVVNKAWYSALEIDKEGYAVALGRTVKVLGTPKYKKETSELGDSIQVLDKAEALAAEEVKEAATDGGDGNQE